MENSKRNLKFISEIILICLAFSFIRTILEVFLSNMSINNIPTEFMLIAKIAICVAYTVLYIPQVYVGFKGIKVANNPDASKAHIVWAVIFLALAAISAISSVFGMISTGNVTGNIFGLIDAVIDLVLYFFFVKFANQVSKAG